MNSPTRQPSVGGLACSFSIGHASDEPTPRNHGFSGWCLGVLLSFPVLAVVGPVEANQAPLVPSQAFGSGFFHGGSQPADLELLLAGSSVLPGQYLVDVYVNGNLNSRREVDFRINAKGDDVEPCLAPSMLREWGVDPSALSEAGPREPGSGSTCSRLAELIEGAQVRFDVAHLRLDFSVPQAYMLVGAQGYVDPSLWDEGVNAAFSSYQLNLRRSENSKLYNNASYLGLQNGINLGGWRLRNESSLTAGSGQPTEFTSNRTFAEHDVTALKAQLSLGELYSRSSLFDSVRFRGVQLVSDDAMLADSERGYAPVIRGVAQTNATVEVHQNGYLLYSTSVPPGPFVLSDIYPSGSNGDLEVTIIEADGRRLVTRQAFGNLPVMLRKGRLTFSNSAGQLRSNDSQPVAPAFLSSTLGYGLSDNLTGLLGVQAAQDFHAMSLGLGRNTLIGAVSLDVTQSSSRSREERRQGQSVRVLYAKTFANTDTDFMLAAYRYSTEGYRTLSDHVQALGQGSEMQQIQSRSRARLDLTVQQRLGHQRQFGSLYLTASDQRYWNTRNRSQSLSTGYNNYWQRLTYDLGLTHTRNTGLSDGKSDSQLTLSLSFPLGQDVRSARSTLRSTRERNGQHSTQAGLVGYLDEATYYALQGGTDSQGGSSGFASVSTETATGRYDLGYGQGRDYRNLSLGASGSLVAHAGGVNFGRQVGESFALIQVPDTPGVGVANQLGVRTGNNGYAIVPNVQPYRLNWISLDSSEQGADVELENAVQQLVPRRGAVVLSRYQVQLGRRIQFQLYQADGSPIGFGASVESAQGIRLAMSDPYGKALALLNQDQGVLTIKWGKQSCTAHYQLAPRNKDLNYENAVLKCD